MDRRQKLAIFDRGEPTFCLCGKICSLKTSWTEMNPGRRFFGCPSYGTGRSCNFFEWYDPALNTWSKDIMNGLLESNRAMKNDLEKEKRNKWRSKMAMCCACILIVILLIS